MNLSKLTRLFIALCVFLVVFVPSLVPYTAVMYGTFAVFGSIAIILLLLDLRTIETNSRRLLNFVIIGLLATYMLLELFI